MPDEATIAAAIAYLREQDTPNFTIAAKKCNLIRTTLARRYKRECLSLNDAHIELQGNLSINQEAELLKWIDELTNRKLPPTPLMVKNQVEALLKRQIGKNWVSRFYQRHKDRLQSKYLGGLDANRVYAIANQEC